MQHERITLASPVFSLDLNIDFSGNFAMLNIQIHDKFRDIMHLESTNYAHLLR